MITAAILPWSTIYAAPSPLRAAVTTQWRMNFSPTSHRSVGSTSPPGDDLWGADASLGRTPSGAPLRTCQRPSQYQPDHILFTVFITDHPDVVAHTSLIQCPITAQAGADAEALF